MTKTAICCFFYYYYYHSYYYSTTATSTTAISTTSSRTTTTTTRDWPTNVQSGDCIALITIHCYDDSYEDTGSVAQWWV